MTKQNKALFLDRDGVVNVDYGHVGTIERLAFMPNILTLCQSAKREGYKIIVVTNQAGIAKKKYLEENFLQLTQYIHEEFAHHNANIDSTFFCPYHNDSKIAEYQLDDSVCDSKCDFNKLVKKAENIYSSFYRKPHGGMIIQAANMFDIDLSKSILIGDKISDIESGSQAGVGKNILIESQYGTEDNGIKPDRVITELPKCIDELINF